MNAGGPGPSAPDDWAQVWELFHAALEAGDETATRDAATRADGVPPEVWRQVQSLLAAHRAADDSFLQPTSGVLTAAIGEADPLVGHRLGGYRVREVLGEGGMGVVYAADQEEPVRRRVALKVIRRGMDNPDVLARFAAERQALAMMSHPAIATVLDAGMTEDGRPFFVMERVFGRPMDEHCDVLDLSLAERLRLFAQVCRGVHHAHQKGIVHRDLKPSNVLVAIFDGESFPKVIDFGIARAVSGRLTEDSFHTQMGSLIGTPEYMSPEQADLRGDVDARSDVYALGMILYRLVAGALPFDSKQLRQGYGEMRRLIHEVEPAAPSTLRASAAPVDAMVLRALAKDPAKRQGSAAELAAEAERSAEAESAAAPGSPTPFAEPARRSRVWWVAAVTVVTTFLVGAWVWWPPSPEGPVEKTSSPLESSLAVGEKRVALTFDDVPAVTSLRPETLTQVTDGLLTALERHGAPAVAFAAGARTDTEAGRMELRRWQAAGHELGNHTYAHSSFCKVSAAAFIEDIRRADAVLRTLTEAPSLFFRHPYICTGREWDDRQKVEDYLAANGYEVAPVTIESHDYLFYDVYREAVENGDADLQARIADAYLDYVDAMFVFVEEVSLEVAGREIPHVVLFHASRLNADVLDRMLERLASRGYRFVLLSEVLADPIYATPDDYLGNVGASWLFRWASSLDKVVAWELEPEPPAWIQDL